MSNAQNQVMKTCSIPVLKCNAQGDYLLSVNPGLSATAALEMASVLLDSVVGLLDDMPLNEQRGHSVEAAICLASLAKATIDAVEVCHG